ncbi:hypothetical protein [Sphingomonas sp. ACRSK]|uniref:hypothetical protein n=1 Tax=Sphingomonas sp. ACRSK TaxID=2918213 RepID=UPI001EF5D4C8|nr:hypothetical protein [Sphingomonas sp. ACRSK]MCG7348868.1 hypothetical protein [Sphingomonas sp. ACRSK]
MKTSSTYKLQRLSAAIKVGEKPQVIIRGEATSHRIQRLRNKQHSVELALEKNGGFLIVDPDDILAILVRSQPNTDDA